MNPLKDHRLLLLVPIRLSSLAGTLRLTPHPHASDAVQRYFTPSILRLLYNRRFEAPKWTASVPDCDVLRTALVLHGYPSGPAAGVLGLVLRSSSFRNVNDLLVASDEWRMLRPWHASHQVPGWSHDGTRFPWLQGLVDHLVPGAQPWFDDPRALRLTFASVEHWMSPVDAYRLVLADPPAMQPPPADLVTNALTRFSYRRWESEGTTWAFCHHGGACITTAPAPWLPPLFDDLYFDLAIAVAMAAMARSQGSPTVFDTEDSSFPRFTEQDQGRQIARAWLAAIEDDRGDLARHKLPRP